MTSLRELSISFKEINSVKKIYYAFSLQDICQIGKRKYEVVPENAFIQYVNYFLHFTVTGIFISSFQIFKVQIESKFCARHASRYHTCTASQNYGNTKFLDASFSGKFK